MADFVEVSGQGPPRLFALEKDQVSIGRGPENDLAIDDDSISWLHAALVRYGTVWCVRDLGSSNGTAVNGERIDTERRLHNNDEVQLGQCRLHFRSAEARAAPTDDAEQRPKITRREQDVLTALCEPLRSGTSTPTSVPDIAATLGIGEDGVRYHLANLYQRLGIDGPQELRLVTLANEAIRRQLV